MLLYFTQQKNIYSKQEKFFLVYFYLNFICTMYIFSADSTIKADQPWSCTFISSRTKMARVGVYMLSGIQKIMWQRKHQLILHVCPKILQLKKVKPVQGKKRKIFALEARSLLLYYIRHFFLTIDCMEFLLIKWLKELQQVHNHTRGHRIKSPAIVLSIFMNYVVIHSCDSMWSF